MNESNLVDLFFRNRNCETRIVERFDYDESAADWADAIFAGKIIEMLSRTSKQMIIFIV